MEISDIFIHTSFFSYIQPYYYYYSSRVVILILSKDVLKVESAVFASEVAIFYSIRIILIHYQTSCFFPGLAEQPKSLSSAGVFHDKAVTYIQQYVKACVRQVLKKLEPPSRDAILKSLKLVKTRAFLSHKR